MKRVEVKIYTHDIRDTGKEGIVKDGNKGERRVGGACQSVKRLYYILCKVMALSARPPHVFLMMIAFLVIYV